MQIRRNGNNADIVSHIIGWLRESLYVSERREYGEQQNERREKMNEPCLSQWHWTTITSNFLYVCHSILLYDDSRQISKDYTHWHQIGPLRFHRLAMELFWLLLSLLSHATLANWLHISLQIKIIFASLDNYLNSQMNQYIETRQCVKYAVGQQNDSIRHRYEIILYTVS